MAAGFLPAAFLGFLFAVSHVPSWPDSQMHMAPKVFVGLTIGGALPYLALATYGALVGLFIAIVRPRLPQFNFFVMGALVYAVAYFSPYVLWLVLGVHYVCVRNPHMLVKSFLVYLVITILMGVVFAWLCPRSTTAKRQKKRTA
jgi:hypothetical protein